jgi:hypothetical protein
MRARTLPVKPIKSGGRGPSKYLFSEKDSRGNPRSPKPRLLFGDPGLFERCVERGNLNHPYASYVLSYKGEENAPTAAVREEIHRNYLRLLAGGFAEDRVLAIGVDHGDDEHGALLRNLVAPNWPGFQPYYHNKDKYCFSAFQWLTNRCHGLRAPEDPANYEWISIAGKHFDERQIECVARLRFLIEGELLRPDGLASHKEFLTFLNRKGYRATVVPHPKAEEDPADDVVDPHTKERRVWLEVRADDGPTVLLKGPLSDPGFQRKPYERQCQDENEVYRRFLDNPYPLWESFLRGVRFRNERNRKRFPAFCEDYERLEYLGFASLHPERHLQGPPNLRETEIA